jgi:hypothetical protein
VQLNPAGSTPAPADEAARAIAKLVAPHLADKGNGSA